MKTLETIIPQVRIEALKPVHYIKQELSLKSAPSLFRDRTEDGKPCLAITLDDGTLYECDLIRVSQQELTFHAADCASPALSIVIKKKVW